MAGESVTFVAAFGAGVVSFLSPCVLPIVPAYLSVITGLDITGLDLDDPSRGTDSPERGGVLVDTRQERRVRMAHIARDTSLFIAGFSAVFVLLGLAATSIGSALFRNQDVLTRVSGLMLLGMAMFLAGSLVLQAPWLYQERRFQPRLARFGPFVAPVAGVAFGFGWTPCIGPVLTSVLAVAATSGSAARGGLLLAVYSLGLGIPFLVAGLAWGRVAGGFGWVKRHPAGITLAASVMLGFFGLLLTFDQLPWMTARLQEGLDAVGLGGLVTVG